MPSLFQRLGGPAVISRGGAGGGSARHATLRSGGPHRRRRPGNAVLRPKHARARSRRCTPRRRRDRGLRLLARLQGPARAEATGSSSATSPTRRRPARASAGERRRRLAAQPARPSTEGSWSTASRRRAAAGSSSGCSAPDKHRTLVRSRTAAALRSGRRGPLLRLCPERRRRSRLMVRGRHRHGAGRVLFTLQSERPACSGRRADRALRLRDRPRTRARATRTRPDRRGQPQAPSGCAQRGPRGEQQPRMYERTSRRGGANARSGRLGVADRSVESRARLGEQPAAPVPLEVDHVVLDRGVGAVRKRG